MNFDLTAITRRAKNLRRRLIVLRAIEPTASMAGDLYRAAYLPLIRGWQEQVPHIEAAYARTLPAVGIRDSADDAQSAIDRAETWLTRIIIAITPSLRAWALRSERWQRGKWTGAVLTATGISIGTMLSPDDVQDTVGAFITRNVALVRSVNDDTRHRIADIVLRGYQGRVPPRDVARDMRAAVEMGRARALRIAADQSSKLASRLDEARQAQAGITKFKYRHSFKRHPRPVHQARDGKLYDAKTLREVDGDDVIAAGDAPGIPPFCGCRRQAVLSFD